MIRANVHRVHQRLTLSRVTASVDERTIAGTICYFDRPTSDGRHFHALTPREPFRNVKLLIEHDDNRSVGYMTDYAATATEATATFTVAPGPAGDQALADVASGVRDGFSIGAAVTDFRFTDDGIVHFDVAELVETSLVSVPAHNLTRVTPTEKEPDMDPEEQTASTAPEPAVVELQAASTHTATASPPAPAAPVETCPPALAQARGMSLAHVARTVASAFNTGDRSRIIAALADIVPSEADPDGVILRGEWLGELFTASRVERPWIDSFGPVQPLNSLKAKGYRWLTKPKPGKYAGEKAEVPTGTVSTEEAEFIAERWAGGWDIDRAFIDFGDVDFLTTFWNAAMDEYKLESDKDIAAKVIAAATPGAASPTLLAALSGVARDLRRIGATASRIVLADDLFDEWANLKVSDVPHWLANVVGGVNISDGTAQVGPLQIAVDEQVPDGTLVAYDRRAAVVREKTPIQLKAFDVAHAGVDLGFYSYGRLDVHDARAIVKRTVTPAAPAGGE